MPVQKQIRFCYKKMIDAAAVAAWDKDVFESSYTEFLMQAQLFNQQKLYSSFEELLQNNLSAGQLHFLVSAAVTQHIQQLHKTMPDITDSLGNNFLQFSHYRFEIIRSHIHNKSAHSVAILFYSEPLWWLDTVGEWLLVASATPQNVSAEILTHLVRIQPQFSIYSLQEKIMP